MLASIVLRPCLVVSILGYDVICLRTLEIRGNNNFGLRDLKYSPKIIFRSNYVLLNFVLVNTLVKQHGVHFRASVLHITVAIYDEIVFAEVYDFLAARWQNAEIV